ncbi:MAG TPA: hypothetical protein VGD81_04090 [Opitutaceae bacterium]
MRSRVHATLAFAVALALWLWRGGPFLAAVAIVTAALVLLAWVAPGTYAPIARGLDRVAHRFGAGVTWLVLVIVYLGVFTPLRLWRTLAGTDPLQLRPRPGAASYLQPLPPARPERFDRQF